MNEPYDLRNVIDVDSLLDDALSRLTLSTKVEDKLRASVMSILHRGNKQKGWTIALLSTDDFLSAIDEDTVPARLRNELSDILKINQIDYINAR